VLQLWGDVQLVKTHDGLTIASGHPDAVLQSLLVGRLPDAFNQLVDRVPLARLHIVELRVRALVVHPEVRHMPQLLKFGLSLVSRKASFQCVAIVPHQIITYRYCVLVLFDAGVAVLHKGTEGWHLLPTCLTALRVL
jgi:hypothetical protein